MKILIDARLYGLENAGLGRYLINLVDSLSYLDKKNNYVILLREEHYNQLKLPSAWEKVKADFRHYSFKEQFFLPFIIAKHKPDLVHFPHFNVPLLYFGKFVVTIHDVLMHKFKGNETTSLPLPFYALRRLGYKLSFAKAVLASEKIIVPSRAVKGELLEEYKIDRQKVIVTYEGVDGKKFNWVYNKRARNILGTYGLKFNEYFIYSGNAYPHKNLNKTIEACLSLNRNLKWKAVFAICGSRNVFTNRLKNYVKKIDAGSYIKILGFVPDNNYKVLLNHSIGFIYPSLSEGFGLQGLEAIASGTLLLASDIPVFREAYGAHAIYFDPKDVNSMVAAMQKAIELGVEFKKREKFVADARNFIKRYSWSKMAKETLNVYESCASV